MLTYNANGGEVDTETKTLYYEQNYGILPTPVREGYECIGWYKGEIANEETKSLGVIHHVFNSTGKVVFSAKKKLVLLSYKNKKAGVKNANWYT